MSKIDFLRRFTNKSEYEAAKKTLPYPSISLTLDDGELYLEGVTAQRTVILTSNAKDAVITIDGNNYPFSNGKLTLHLDEGSYPYVISKGSLSDEYTLSVSPTALTYVSSGESKTIAYTSTTTTYPSTLSGTLVVNDNVNKAINFVGTTTNTTPTWSDNADWLTNSNNVFTASANEATASRTATITATNGTVTKTVSVSQNGKVITEYDVTIIAHPMSIDNGGTLKINGQTITMANAGTDALSGGTSLPNGTYAYEVIPPTQGGYQTYVSSPITTAKTINASDTEFYLEYTSVHSIWNIPYSGTVTVNNGAVIEQAVLVANVDKTDTASSYSLASWLGYVKTEQVDENGTKRAYYSATTNTSTASSRSDNANFIFGGNTWSVPVTQNASSVTKYDVTFIVNGPDGLTGTVEVNGETINLETNPSLFERATGSTSLANGTYPYVIQPASNYNTYDNVNASPNPNYIAATGGEFTVTYTGIQRIYTTPIRGTVTVNNENVEVVENVIGNTQPTQGTFASLPEWLSTVSNEYNATSKKYELVLSATPNTSVTQQRDGSIFLTVGDKVDEVGFIQAMSALTEATLSFSYNAPTGGTVEVKNASNIVVSTVTLTLKNTENYTGSTTLPLGEYTYTLTPSSDWKEDSFVASTFTGDSYSYTGGSVDVTYTSSTTTLKSFSSAVTLTSDVTHIIDCETRTEPKSSELSSIESWVNFTTKSALNGVYTYTINIDTNDTASARTATIYYMVEGVRQDKAIVITQGFDGGIVTGQSYDIQNIYPNSLDTYLAWNVGSITYTYDGVTYNEYADGHKEVVSRESLSGEESVDNNTGSTSTTRTGSFFWNNVKGVWQASQHGALEQDLDTYHYEVIGQSISVTPNKLEWDATAATISYTVEKIPVTYNGTEMLEDRTQIPVSNQAVTHGYGENTGTNERTVGNQFSYPATGTALTGGSWTAQQKPGAFIVTIETNAPGGTISIS